MSYRSVWEGCSDAPRISGWARDVIAGRWGMRLLVAEERDGGQEGGFWLGVLQIKGEFVIFALVIV